MVLTLTEMTWSTCSRTVGVATYLQTNTLLDDASAAAEVETAVLTLPAGVSAATAPDSVTGAITRAAAAAMLASTFHDFFMLFLPGTKAGRALRARRAAAPENPEAGSRKGTTFCTK